MNYSKIQRTFLIIATIFIATAAIINLIYGAEFPEGPAHAGPLMDNIFRFYGGILLGISLVLIYLARTHEEHNTIFYLVGFMILMAATGRLIARHYYGWPEENLYLWNIPPLFIFTIPIIFELSIGSGMIILQYLRGKSEPVSVITPEKKKLDTNTRILRICLILVICFIGPASTINLITGTILPYGDVYGARMNNLFRFYGGALFGLAVITAYLAITIRQHHRIFLPFGILIVLAGVGRLISGLAVGWPSEPTYMGNISPFLLYTIPVIFELVVGTTILIVQSRRE